MEKEIDNQNENEIRPYKHNKKQNAIYTIISVAIFFVLYYGAKNVTAFINREYFYTLNSFELTGEQLTIVEDYTKIKLDENASVDFARYDKMSDSKIITIRYKNISDKDLFIENNIFYEYGNVVTDYRYQTVTGEYVYGDSYVNIENPAVYCILYEIDGDFYAEFKSDEITTEIMTAIKKGERMYYTE